MKNTAQLFFIFILSIVLFGCKNVATLPDSQPKTKCDYLVMAYMDGDCNVNIWTRAELIQMETALYELKQKNPDVNVKVVALWDGSDKYTATFDSHVSVKCNYPDSKLYELGERTPDCFIIDDYKPEMGDMDERFFDTCPNTKDLTDKAKFIPKINNHTEVNMAKKETLSSFIDFCYDNYDFNKSMLIIRGHGIEVYSNTPIDTTDLDNRALCPDETDNLGAIFIGTNEFGDILKHAYEKSNKKINMLFIPNCITSGFEELYEVRKYADYYFGSSTQSIINFKMRIIKNAITNITLIDKPEEFGKIIIDNYLTDFSNSFSTEELKDYEDIDLFNVDADVNQAMGVYDLSKVDLFYETFDKLLSEIYKYSYLFKSYGDFEDYSKNLEEIENKFLYHYMIAKDTSYLYPRNYYGLTDISDSSSCTSLSYSGSFNILIDVGYFLDMLIKNIPECDNTIIKEYDYIFDSDTDVCIEPVYYTKEELIEFKNLCRTAVKYLEDMVIYSDRMTFTKQKTVQLYPMLIDQMNKADNTREYKNHYGITLCSSRKVRNSQGHHIFDDIPLCLSADYLNYSTFGAKSTWYWIGYFLMNDY